MEKKKVLIAIPAYNEGKSIRHIVREINRLHPDFTIAVINDGSSDNTASEAAAAGAIVISHPFNLGIGGAVQTGYKFAGQNGFDVMVQMDGDGQHDPQSLSAVLNPVLADELDLAVGSRFLDHRSGFKSTFSRRIGIRFFSLLLGSLTEARLTDPTSGFRATGKSLIHRFAVYYPIDFPEPEAIIIAKRYHARIGEVPVHMRSRTEGQSSIRHLKTIYYMLKVTAAILIDSLKRKE